MSKTTNFVVQVSTSIFALVASTFAKPFIHQVVA